MEPGSSTNLTSLPSRSQRKAAEQWNYLSDVDFPTAVKTPLGWNLFGNVNQGHCERVIANFLASDKEITLQHQIERFWEIDSFATKQVLSESTSSVEDKRALAILESSTVKEEGH